MGGGGNLSSSRERTEQKALCVCELLSLKVREKPPAAAKCMVSVPVCQRAAMMRGEKGETESSTNDEGITTREQTTRDREREARQRMSLRFKSTAEAARCCGSRVPPRRRMRGARTPLLLRSQPTWGAESGGTLLHQPPRDSGLG